MRIQYSIPGWGDSSSVKTIDEHNALWVDQLCARCDVGCNTDFDVGIPDTSSFASVSDDEMPSLTSFLRISVDGCTQTPDRTLPNIYLDLGSSMAASIFHGSLTL